MDEQELVSPRTGLGIRILRGILPLLYVAVLVVPAWVFFGERGGIEFLRSADFHVFASRAFPLFGLYAFTLLWVQFLLGAAMPIWRRVYSGIERFHRVQGVFVLLFALTHAGLVLAGFGISGYLTRSFLPDHLRPFALLGQTALYLLLLTVSTALLRRTRWLAKRWRFIHYANYVVFVLAWVHSWNIGTDIQTSALRWFWLAYGATAIVAAVAGRLVRVRLRRRARLALESAGNSG
jgi:predicted ferric reductase